MYKKHGLEFMVGLFMLAGAIAFIVLALQVSGLTSYSTGPTYQITANFENVGDLKERAMVTVAGVNVGRVTDIALNPTT
ncbi:MAG: MlaD family protein, partial [Pseudomonadota bacterium]